MLTQRQREEFVERGYFRVSQAFSRDAASLMADRFWSHLKASQGVCRRDPSTWTEGIVGGISDLKRAPEFQGVGSPITLSVLDDLLGQDEWRQPATWGQILATFPAPEWSWNSLFQRRVDVGTVQWHTDYEYTMSFDKLAGVQVFAILADLESGGGGTLVLEGSPRLIHNFVQRQPSEVLQKMKRARQALMKSHSWLESISRPTSLARPEKWMAEQKANIGGVSLAVAELTGKAGDVLFCHPWFLHSISPNCNKTPRLMCTQRIRRREDSNVCTQHQSTRDQS